MQVEVEDADDGEADADDDEADEDDEEEIVEVSPGSWGRTDMSSRVSGAVLVSIVALSCKQ